MQVKLLRVLDKQEYDPLGSVRTEHTDVRVVAATHKDLWEMVKNRQFRHDLFFRLNVMSITIPPLRERREDIPLLADLYIRSHCEQVRGKAPSLSPRCSRSCTNIRFRAISGNCTIFLSMPLCCAGAR